MKSNMAQHGSVQTPGSIKASQVVVLKEDTVVVTQRKRILILKLNMTSMRNIYIKSGLR